MLRRLACLPAPFHEPPEGGWGWVVILASFVSHVITLGVAYSFGVLYRALLADASLGGDRGATALVGSSASAATLAAGVFVSAIVTRYGHRAAAGAGAALVPLGLLLSSVVTDLPSLYFTWGVLLGTGSALSFMPAVMVVSRYFVKRRAFATGIAVAGSGVGTLVFGAVSDYLISRVGWRATLRVYAVLSAVVLSAAAATYVPVLTGAPPAGAAGSKAAALATAPARDADARDGGGDDAWAQPPPPAGEAATDVEGTSAVVAASAAAAPPGGGGLARAPASPWPEGGDGGGEADFEAATPSSRAPAPAPSSSILPPPPAPAAAAPPRPALTATGVWREPAFLPMAAVLFVYGGGLFTVYAHIVVAAGDAGLPPERAAALVSLMGVAGTVGRVAFGRVADHPRVDKVLLFQVSLMLAGGAVLLFAAAGRGSPAAPPPAGGGDATFAVFVVGALLFGLFSGAIVSQVPVIMAENLGLESLPAAMGGSYTIQAPAVLVSPPLAGAARAWLGNYYALFIVVALAMTLSPLLLYFMPGRGCGGRAATRLR